MSIYVSILVVLVIHCDPCFALMLPTGCCSCGGGAENTAQGTPTAAATTTTSTTTVGQRMPTNGGMV